MGLFEKSILILINYQWNMFYFRSLTRWTLKKMLTSSKYMMEVLRLQIVSLWPGWQEVTPAGSCRTLRLGTSCFWNCWQMAVWRRLVSGSDGAQVDLNTESMISHLLCFYIIFIKQNNILKFLGPTVKWLCDFYVKIPHNVKYLFFRNSILLKISRYNWFTIGDGYIITQKIKISIIYD